MATAKISTKECYKCHFRKPANEMKKETIQVESGSSLGIYGIGPGKGKARGSVRKHFRNKEVWICDSCNAIRAKEAGATLKIWGIVLVIIVVAIVLYNL